MWFNYQSNQCDPPDLIARTQRGKCFVNGSEVKEVWYANTDTGEVKTYDVLGDGRVHLADEVLDGLTTESRKAHRKAYAAFLATPDAPEGLDLTGAVASKTIRGVVEIVGPKQ